MKILGIIGGSGIYEIDGLQNAKWIEVKSSFGQPSDNFLTGVLNGVHKYIRGCPR